MMKDKLAILLMQIGAKLYFNDENKRDLLKNTINTNITIGSIAEVDSINNRELLELYDEDY